MKKYFVSILMVFCMLAMVGCANSSQSVFIDTADNIYSFYVESILTSQTGYDKDVKKVQAEQSQNEKISFLWNSKSIVNVEELAIISSIECYNMTSSQKELYLQNGEGDDLITVKQVRNTYECSLTQNGTKYNYSFIISRDASSKTYKVTYKLTLNEEEKSCTSYVLFDKTNSYYLADDLSISKIEVLKDFYNLKNNHTACRFNVILGSGNNSLMYAFNIYKQGLDFGLKISNIERKEDNIDENVLSLSKFSQSSQNDKCGFIVTYKSSKNETVTNTFGDMSKW